MHRITSRQNAVVSRYRDAARGHDPHTVLLDGVHLVAEAATAGCRFSHVLVSPDAATQVEVAALLDTLVRMDAPVAEASAAVLEAASPVRSASPIVALIERPAERLPYAQGTPLAVLACDIQDPGNMGAIVRVSEAAGATGVVAAGTCADPFGWKALRGSMGSALRLPISRVSSIQSAVDDALRHGTRLVATVPRDGTPLFQTDLTGPLALLIGGEGPGLPHDAIEAAAVRVTIPMEAPVESLNAAVATALLLYEVRRQRGPRGQARPTTSD